MDNHTFNETDLVCAYIVSRLGCYYTECANAIEQKDKELLSQIRRHFNGMFEHLIEDIAAQYSSVSVSYLACIISETFINRNILNMGTEAGILLKEMAHNVMNYLGYSPKFKYEDSINEAFAAARLSARG